MKYDFGDRERATIISEMKIWLYIDAVKTKVYLHDLAVIYMMGICIQAMQDWKSMKLCKKKPPKKTTFRAL